jgi:IMP and pyridine-specific 5'-nucleotidase
VNGRFSLYHMCYPLRLSCSLYRFGIGTLFSQTKRKHIQPSFNELRHVLNLAQLLALRKTESTNGVSDEPNGTQINQNEDSSSVQLNGPRMVTFDGDQTLYSDGANFESNPRLAFYIYQLLRHGVAVAVVTAAGYEYEVTKYEYRLSGLLHYFQQRGLSQDECERFYLFGGECNYLLQMGQDFRLHPVKESGPGGWSTSTKYLLEAPGNWSSQEVQGLLEGAEESFRQTQVDLNLRGRIIRKRRSVGLIPLPDRTLTRESLDEAVLRVHEKLHGMNGGRGPGIPFCAFNGGGDAWVDCGSKRVGVRILQCYLGIEPAETLHIGDQFLNTGNDYAARDASPCVWIVSPIETQYVLKTILRLAGVEVALSEDQKEEDDDSTIPLEARKRCVTRKPSGDIDFDEIERRRSVTQEMNVYTGEMLSRPAT